MTDNWQDIDSAPRDGTAILVYCPDADHPNIVLAHWREFVGSPDPGDWHDWWDDNAPSIDTTVTHWQPLPAPPVKP